MYHNFVMILYLSSSSKVERFKRSGIADQRLIELDVILKLEKMKQRQGLNQIEYEMFDFEKM